MKTFTRKEQRRGLFSEKGIDGAKNDQPTFRPLNFEGSLSFTGPRVKQMTSNLDQALLERNCEQTLKSLDEMMHLFELVVEELVDSEGTPLQAIVWRTQVLRLLASRAQRSMQRMPEFVDHVRNSDYGATFISRMFGVLAFFTDLTLHRAADGLMSPEAWFKAEPSLVRCRVNIGIAYFHMSRIMQECGYDDPDTNQERFHVFSANFDIMFYALTYGPLEHGNQSKDLVVLLEDHLETVAKFLDGPQPSIASDPTMYAITKTHVLHVLTTVARVREILPSLVG